MHLFAFEPKIGLFHEFARGRCFDLLILDEFCLHSLLVSSQEVTGQDRVDHFSKRFGGW